MPRHHYRAVRVSHCDWDGCPDPAGESGECPKHEAERIRRDGLVVTRPAPSPAFVPVCRVCREPLADLDWTTCELCRHAVPDTTEEP